MARTSKDGFPIRLIGLHNITVDHDLQSRVQTDIGTQLEYSEDMMRGDKFPFLVVFDDGEKLWLSSGFTRHGAALKAGLTDFECEIRPGEKRDAVVFSTSANKDHGKRPTPEDNRKSCEMLFADSEWSQMSTAVIAKHVGISPITTRKYRVNFYAKTGQVFPEKFNAQNGRTVPSTSKAGGTISIYTSPKGRTQCSYSVKNRKVILSSNPDKAKLEFERIQQDKEMRKRLFASSQLVQKFVTNRIPSNCPDFHPKAHSGLFGLIVKEHFVTWTPLDNPIDATHAVSRAILGSVYAKTTGRKVVLCDPENAPAAIIDLARQAGVEFITPEDFVASLEGEQGSQLRAAQ